MQEPMNSYVYSIYLLALKHGMPPKSIYMACNNMVDKECGIHSISFGPYGTTRRPPYGPADTMYMWMIRHIREPYFYTRDFLITPEDLSNFIFKHGTGKIKLTICDRIKKRILKR